MIENNEVMSGESILDRMTLLLPECQKNKMSEKLGVTQ